MNKEHVQLTETDHETLAALVRKGTASVRVLKRALGLLALAEGETLTAVAQHQNVSIQTVGNWRNGYRAKGLAMLQDAPRPGRPVAIAGGQRAQVTALACSEAPPGHGQWSLRLLAEKVVELGYCETISHTYVGEILKKTNSSRI